MKLSHVKGNTWVAEGLELIPVLRLDGQRCVLLDTGLREERDELEACLLENGLIPVGIVGSHAHGDHCGNNRYFQEQYNIPVALTVPEAGMCSSLMNLKCYFLLLSPDMVQREFDSMVHTPEVILPGEDATVTFAGVPLQIIQTPGHSPGHISVITPDNVCYVADALVSRDYLSSKLPYSLCHATAGRSRDKLRGVHCDAYIMAHRGVCSAAEFGALIDDNDAMIYQRAQEILALIPRPMTGSQINQVVCEQFHLLTRRPGRSLRFERNIRLFAEYLLDLGQLEMVSLRGVAHYQPAGWQG